MITRERFVQWMNRQSLGVRIVLFVLFIAISVFCIWLFGEIAYRAGYALGYAMGSFSG